MVYIHPNTALYYGVMTHSGFKKPPSKAQLRARLDQDIDAFIASGGEINEIDQGETALEPSGATPPVPVFTDTKKSRTPLDHVIAELNARRSLKTKPRTNPRRTRKPQARKRIIYDDFGEPLRTVWDDE